MKRWKRKIILALAIIIFITAAPLLILYASGYRYNFTNGRLEKIGMLIIESTPKNVDVYLNNKIVANKTPYRANNLLPGKYQVKVTKNGYGTWEKNLAVESQLVTWASQVKIFALDPPARLLAQKKEITEYHLSPNAKKIVYVTKTDKPEIWLVDIKNGQENQQFPHPASSFTQHPDLPTSTITDLQWSPDNRKIIFNLTSNNQVKHFMLDTEKPEQTILLPYLNLQEIKWDNNDGDFLYGRQKNTLVSLNIREPAKLNKIAVDVQDYDLGSNYLVYAKSIAADSSTTAKTIIYQLEKNKTEWDGEITVLFELPAGNYQLQAGAENSLALQSADQELFLIKAGELKKLQNNVVNFQWLAKKPALLFSTTNEIWFYRATTENNINHPQYALNKANLLTHRDNVISWANWHPAGEHIFFISDNQLSIMELDQRDKNNYHALLAVDNQEKSFGVFLDEEGQKIYYRKHREENDQLWEQTIY